MMEVAFHTGEYETYFFLGEPRAEPLWNWSAWSRAAAALDPVVAAARGAAAVRSMQYLPDRKGTVRFGRIAWNEKGHQKWTHGSPSTAAESGSWTFLDVQVWAPAWTVCERENQAPDVYFNICNEALSGGYNKPLAFNPVVLLAVAVPVAAAIRDRVAAAVAELASLTQARLAGYRRRPWGTSIGDGGFTNGMQDLCVAGLFQVGPRHDGPPGFHLLTEKWEPLAPPAADPQRISNA
jgi:hypothetical protein